MKPGHFISISNIDFIGENIKEELYYEIAFNEESTLQKSALNYDKSQKMLRNLLDDAIQKRMASDSRVGLFLDGDIPTSIIHLIAKKHQHNLPTFSLKLKENLSSNQKKDDTTTQEKGSNHHVFSLSNNDLYEDFENLLDYYDEPFAELSAISFYLISKRSKQHLSTTLNGIGAKELFAGYHRHDAEFRTRNVGIKDVIVKMGHPLWQTLPKKRASKVADINRKLHKFSLGSKLTHKARYWEWTSIINEEKANYLLKEELVFNPHRLSDTAFEYKKRKDEILKTIQKKGDINDVLYTDIKMGLTNNGLKKLDIVNMTEENVKIRSPFLDHRLVNFAFSLPVAFKINTNTRMKILQDAFSSELPTGSFSSPNYRLDKPLLGWFRNELKSTIENDLLSDHFIEKQGLFNVIAVQSLKKELFSNHPNNVQETVWALIVFNTWWKKHFEK